MRNTFAILAVVLMVAPSNAQQLDLSGATVVMSSGENADLGVGALAFDGDRGTRLATGNDPDPMDGNDNEWFYVDLGDIYKLSEIRIDWEAAHGQDIDLLISNENPGDQDTASPTDALWTRIAEMRGYDQDGDFDPVVSSHGGDVDNIFNFVSGEVALPSDMGGAGTGSILVNEPEGQYVMMHGIQRGSEWGFSVYEMEIDGTLVPEPSSVALLCGGAFMLIAGLRRSRKNA